MSPSMHIGQAWADRVRDVSWPLVYGFNILICIGQIIASEITNRYGGTIFGATAVTGSNSEDAEINFVERDHALARTGVVSSIGIAIGSVNLILTMGSFVAYSYLDYRRTRKHSRRDYDQRFIIVFVVTTLNLILFGGNIGLTVGYVLTSRIVKRYTTVESSATPGYLLAAGIMAALSGNATRDHGCRL
ncbi:hypothetical protein EJ08DRAFT_272562 [Tothia fuscella]|uniref:Uncharacterized protein n=1 Tax=Tothia fuscella TaxID=1048955 RepID=A0A9P4NQ94_9PEZI|nr:hypothetical protein EJ08DRAFT_272562 [Tothia fuscella]